MIDVKLYQVRMYLKSSGISQEFGLRFVQIIYVSLY